MPFTNDLLANPFTKNSWQNQYGLPTPSTLKTNEGLNIKTTKPILELNPTTGKKITFEKSQALKDFQSKQKLDTRMATDKANKAEEKKSWWSARSKTQKIGIVAGSLIATVAIVYFIRKARR